MSQRLLQLGVSMSGWSAGLLDCQAMVQPALYDTGQQFRLLFTCTAAPLDSMVGVIGLQGSGRPLSRPCNKASS